MNSGSNNNIYQIYDKILKKILTLSVKAVINLINGLFDTDYALDSTIIYNWTEHHDDDLNRTIADTIMTINGKYTYHIEAQVYEDENIEFRVFDYGYKHALKTRSKQNILKFPEPQIIYLYHHKHIPDEKLILLDFGTQGTFQYHVPTFKLLEHNLQELDQRNLIILIPFMILRLRDSIRKERTPEVMEALRSLIMNDIIGLIKKNQDAGNITSTDASILRNLIYRLYKHLYAHYEEFEKGGLNHIMEDNFILEVEQAARQVQTDTIRKLYSKLNSVEKVAELLDFPVEMVQKALV